MTRIRRKNNPVVVISSSQRVLRVPRKRITQLISYVADAEGVQLAEVDLAVVTKKQIAAVNRQYLHHAGSTDVISFDLTDPYSQGIRLQLVVCGEIAVEQARKRNIGPQRELMLYIVHGLLHVVGYDDSTRDQSEKMHTRQEELLRDYSGVK